MLQISSSVLPSTTVNLDCYDLSLNSQGNQLKLVPNGKTIAFDPNSLTKTELDRFRSLIPKQTVLLGIMLQVDHDALRFDKISYPYQAEYQGRIYSISRLKNDIVDYPTAYVAASAGIV